MLFPLKIIGTNFGFGGQMMGCFRDVSFFVNWDSYCHFSLKHFSESFFPIQNPVLLFRFLVFFFFVFFFSCRRLPTNNKSRWFVDSLLFFFFHFVDQTISPHSLSLFVSSPLSHSQCMFERRDTNTPFFFIVIRQIKPHRSKNRFKKQKKNILVLNKKLVESSSSISSILEIHLPFVQSQI